MATARKTAATGRAAPTASRRVAAPPTAASGKKKKKAGQAAAAVVTAKPAKPAKPGKPDKAAREDNALKADKGEKARKPKMVRDSFTIPKAEYAVLDELKERAVRLGRPVKKSEVLRAGLKALAAMPDAVFLAGMAAVPAVKTGRPARLP